MSELTVMLIKLSFLAVLWLFVLSAISVIRSDIVGTRAPAAGAVDAGAQRAAKETRSRSKAKRGIPTKLQIVGGPNTGQSVPLGDEPILLGRGTDAAIRLDDDYVSTRHARFATNGEQWFVEDMGSTNGTYVGNQRVAGAVPVGLGVQVKLGKTVVELRK